MPPSTDPVAAMIDVSSGPSSLACHFRADNRPLALSQNNAALSVQ
jgi:hypothetical protein